MASIKFDGVDVPVVGWVALVDGDVFEFSDEFYANSFAQEFCCNIYPVVDILEV